MYLNEWQFWFIVQSVGVYINCSHWDVLAIAENIANEMKWMPLGGEILHIIIFNQCLLVYCQNYLSKFNKRNNKNYY